MEDKAIDKNEEIEVDLRRLLRTLLSKTWLIGLVAILCAVVMFLGTLLVRPKYESSVMFYVNNSASDDSQSGSADSINYSDITASRTLVRSYIAVLNTRETLNEVIEVAGVNRTYDQMLNMISADSVDSTEFFEVVVTSTDPQEAHDIANAIGEVLPRRISTIIVGTTTTVADSSVLAEEPSSPNYMLNTLMAFLVGLVGTVVVIMLQVIFDITIRKEEDATQDGKYPILAAVPNMEAHSVGGYYYGYRRAAYYDRANTSWLRKVEVVGPNISFAASEAYKLLRTKLQFSFAGDIVSHIIGVSSALAGEGKSLTAVNLAYSMSQLGKRVLLIDCDMRRPSVAEKLSVQKNPGLSDFLSGQVGAENLIQLCNIKGDESAFHVISAGRIPPNPMELLSSSKMEKTLVQLRGNYDYIILDLPPVGEVSDALATTKLVDGILLVVRQDYCNRRVLNSAIRQFEFVESKILGVVFNCSSDETVGRSKKYHRKYSKKNYRSNGGSYTAADKKSKQKSTRQK